MSSSNSECSIFFFSLDTFYLSLFLSRTSNTILIKTGDTRHSCLVPDFRGSSCSLCIMLMYVSLHTHFSDSDIINGC